ncbi:MAG: alginate lyase family protein [Pirellulaceae bacterium]
MNPLSRIWWTAKAVGWDNLPRRLLQASRIRSGWLRRQTDPTRFTDPLFRDQYSSTVEQQPAEWRERAQRFLDIPEPAKLQLVATGSQWQVDVLSVCEQALRGEYSYFSRWTGQLGWPPNFNRDPVHSVDWPVGEHWMQTARSGPPRHDIKFVWEPNRFTLAYHFARAYRRDGDERWAEAFWTMFDAWVAQNPVQQSVAWGCGQEIALRLMAMLTAAFATLESPHATPERLWSLARLAWQSAHRIDININYAISQENNHALSEALGLWTVGLLFDEFADARRWRDRGRRILDSECWRQIYEDGSFVQHSLSYHRVMLDDLMWCIRLGQINIDPLPEIVFDRFRRATDWLAQLVDPISGRVPNYGANDGASVLPLACGDYLDYRPTLQAAHWLAHGQRCLDPGPWDEKLLWLCGTASLTGQPQPVARTARWSAPIGGYHVLRGPQSWLLTRCGTYLDRPHQADMLHVDLWYRGLNVLRDGGSFMYYHEDPRWQHFFHSTAAHNTVEIDELDQMIKGPRFLWFRWPKARVVPGITANDDSTLEMVNESYAWLDPPVTHRRTITRMGDSYTIRDTLSSSGPHTARIRWRLFDACWIQDPQDSHTWTADLNGQVFEIKISVATHGAAASAAGPQEPDLNRTIAVEWYCGNDSPPAGWESLYYGEKSPSPTLVITLNFEHSAELATTFHSPLPSPLAPEPLPPIHSAPS